MVSQKLSEIAHELEDVLSPQISQKHGASWRKWFSPPSTHLKACSARTKNKQPPSTDPLRVLIHRLLSIPGPAPAGNDPAARRVEAAFAWSEYERLMISEALLRGENVYNVALAHRSQQHHACRRFSIDSQCPPQLWNRHRPSPGRQPRRCGR